MDVGLPCLIIHCMLDLMVEGPDLASILSIYILLMGLAVQHWELNDGVQVSSQKETAIIINVVTCQVTADYVTRIV